MSILRADQLAALWRMSARGLLMHKLRSLLTVLGLVFGVASVIVMLAVAEGASRQAQAQIESLGVRNIIIRSVRPTEDRPNTGNAEAALEYGVTFDDLRRIEQAVDTVVRTAPQREFVHEIRFLDRHLDGRVVGAQPNYLAANGLTIVRGRFLEPIDATLRANVCVIGAGVAERLFAHRDPIGESIQVADQHLFRVIGVTADRAPSAGIGSSLAAQDYNLDVYIPLETDHSRIGSLLLRLDQGSFMQERVELSQITVEVASRDDVKPTARILEGLLAKYHPQQDFAITVPLDLLERARATQRIFSIVLGSTAAISLLVGGIGIMNIMLASVSERTQEIGIRRALGARQRDIIAQFLMETMLLSLVGVTIGLGLGLVAPSAVSWVSGMEAVITPWAVLIAVVTALGVGVTFGLYPARRAAQLDPIEALRRV
jgi:putative ABC transport system permease protein